MENQSEKIQDYLAGHLKGEDLIQFEEQLKIDDELRNLLSLQREVHEILNKHVVSQEIELRESLTTISNNFRHNPSTNIIDFKKVISFFITACILILCTLFFLKSTDNDLYDLPMLPFDTVNEHHEKAYFEEAINAFNKKDYDGARQKFEKLLSLNPGQVQYSYYIGLTDLGSHAWKQAIETLVSIVNGESVFSAEASYYLAIAYYENGDYTQAISLLKNLEFNKELSVKAKRLLEKFK